MSHSKQDIRRVLGPAFRRTNPHESFQDWVSEAFQAVKDQLGPITDEPGEGSTGSQVMEVASEYWNARTGPVADLDKAVFRSREGLLL